MKNYFDVQNYLNHIANELINNFSIAGFATTPGLVGIARENATRKKLESLLPPLVGVGSGCVIDSFGGVSKQIDIVLYEKNICPIFSINDSEETTYFPCEGVIAAGEIKSKLNNTELEDIFSKVNSVKLLQRLSIPSRGKLVNEATVSFRHYGNTISFECTKHEEFNQSKNRMDQIFCFAFCGDLESKPETILNKFDQLRGNILQENVINLICILNHGMLFYMNKDKKAIRYWLDEEIDTIYFTGKQDNSFQFLINRLYEVFRNYRTTSMSSFSKYILGETSHIKLNGVSIDIK